MWTVFWILLGASIVMYAEWIRWSICDIKRQVAIDNLRADGKGYLADILEQQKWT